MAHIWKDRVLEVSISTGTGNFTLAGAIAGYDTFASACSVNDTLYYLIEAVDSDGIPTGEWETGFGTYSASNILTRTTVLASSNSGAAVNFSSGTKRVALSDTTASLRRHTVTIAISDPNGDAITTGDGKFCYPVPSTLNGLNLLSAKASLTDGGTGGGFLCQLRRKRAGADVDMLSTRISIDSGERKSVDATTPPVINTSNDDVATDDEIYTDLDGVPTGGKGLVIEMQFGLAA